MKGKVTAPYLFLLNEASREEADGLVEDRQGERMASAVQQDLPKPKPRVRVLEERENIEIF